MAEKRINKYLRPKTVAKIVLFSGSMALLLRTSRQETCSQVISGRLRHHLRANKSAKGELLGISLSINKNVQYFLD
jgi:hypothetical protein